jgi:teichuronic acid biosynthesis glycosyltransferase TuaG
MMTKEARPAPTVSVIMPAYNCERYIEQAVRSVIGQTFTDWELIILDDGSSDSTREIIERLAREDDRIIPMPNEKNVGVARTRNRGLDISRGSYIALLDSDDIWREDKLLRQIELARSSGADLIYCSYGIVDEEGNNLCSDFIVHDIADYESTLTRTEISCSTALLSRKLVDKYRFSTEFYHEDLVLWLEILRDGNSARGVIDILADYRVSKGSRASNKLKSALERYKVFRVQMREPFFRSVCLIVKYAVLALKKYKRI